MGKCCSSIGTKADILWHNLLRTSGFDSHSHSDSENDSEDGEENEDEGEKEEDSDDAGLDSENEPG